MPTLSLLSAFALIRFQDFGARPLKVHAQVFQSERGGTVSFQQQPKENTFRSDLMLLHCLRLFRSKLQRSLRSRGVGEGGDDMVLGTGPDEILQFRSDDVVLHTQPSQHFRHNSLLQQTQQQMFCADKIMVITRSLLARDFQSVDSVWR